MLDVSDVHCLESLWVRNVVVKECVPSSLYSATHYSQDMFDNQMQIVHSLYSICSRHYFFFFKVQWLKMAFRTGVEIDFSLPTLHDIRPIRRGTLPQKFAHICKLNSQSLGLEVLQQSFLLWEWSMQALILSNVLFAKKNFEVYILWSWEYFTYYLAWPTTVTTPHRLEWYCEFETFSLQGCLCCSWLFFTNITHNVYLSFFLTKYVAPISRTSRMSEHFLEWIVKWDNKD